MGYPQIRQTISAQTTRNFGLEFAMTRGRNSQDLWIGVSHDLLVTS